MPLISLALLLGSPAGAEPRDDQLTLVVSVDDRRGAMLSAPELTIEQEGAVPAPMIDDGSLPGDTPGDAVFTGVLDVRRAETATLVVMDGGEVFARFDTVLPNAAKASFALTTRPGTRALFADVGAAAVGGVQGTGAGESPQVVQAASAADGTTSLGRLGPDEMAVRVTLDDRAVRRLVAPELRVAQDGSTPVRLLDDGEVEGDVAGDGVWLADVVVRRSQYVQLAVWEADNKLGAVTAFLPSTGAALVGLRTGEGNQPIVIDREPVAATGASTASGGSDGGRLSYVLWVGIALFAIGFGYLRTVVTTLWVGEVRPVLRRLDAWLDRQDEGSR